MRRLLILLMLVGLLVLAACGEDVEEEPEPDEDDVAEVEDDDEPEEDDEPDVDPGRPEDFPDYDVAEQPEDAEPIWITPDEGDELVSYFEMQAEVDGVELVELGDPVVGEGHLVVVVGDCVEEFEVIPGPGPSAERDGFFHLADGSFSRGLELEPGDYDLCLQLVDGLGQTFGQTNTVAITIRS